MPIVCVTAVAASDLRRRAAGCWISVAGSVPLFVASIAVLVKVAALGSQAAEMGNGPTPFGVALATDMPSAVVVVIAGVTAPSVCADAMADVEMGASGYRGLFRVLIAGVTGAFLTGDLFYPTSGSRFELISTGPLVLAARGCRGMRASRS